MNEHWIESSGGSFVDTERMERIRLRKLEEARVKAEREKHLRWAGYATVALGIAGVVLVLVTR